ncbi:DUF4097 family beta strand repeat-containing protein [Paenibacillus odorifer]|uniref:DUF4097 domain-containing protein n=2 Tax=Paenibacillus TaxID=44249 RepID=A0ABX3GMS3_9BACL|nr:DUF4097 family beta strand repeat-containing protein [Paenibacillus odorifer]OMD33392.1 hypothetical protein BSO21_15260 [Paenibacillus odorifer]
MKSTAKKLLTTIGILVTLLIALAGCSSHSTSMEEKNYIIPAQKIDTLTIDVKDKKITILQSKDEQIHIVYYESEKDFYKIDLSDDKELSMVSDSNKEWNDYIGGKGSQVTRTIQVWIPDATLKNLTLKTSNESIVLPTIAFLGTVEVNINNGNIQLDKLNVGTAITLETKNGNISGSILGSYDDFAILSNVKKGDSNLPANKENGSKKLSAYTNNGDITLQFSE